MEDKLDCQIVMTHEPTKQSIGRFIRSNILNRTFDSETEALLFAADRKNHCETVIKPALDAGGIVITERYLYSSLAYQSFQEFHDLDWILEINSQAIVPDLVIFVYSDIDESMNRIRSSLREAEGTSEYFEDIELQKRILASYRKIFWKFGSKGEKNKFFKPELIRIRNDGSMLNYQKKMKRRIIKFFKNRDREKQILKKYTTRTKKFDLFPVDINFDNREVLKKFLEKTLEYSLRWKLHPETLPRTLVTGNMVNLIKSLSEYDKVIHKTMKKLHYETEMSVGYSLETFRRIIRGLKDVGIIHSPDGPRRQRNNFIIHMDLTDTTKIVKAEELFKKRLHRYIKKRPGTRKMVLTDYFYQLSEFLKVYQSPIIYAFIDGYIEDPVADTDEYIEEYIRMNFNGGTKSSE